MHKAPQSGAIKVHYVLLHSLSQKQNLKDDNSPLYMYMYKLTSDGETLSKSSSKPSTSDEVT